MAVVVMYLRVNLRLLPQQVASIPQDSAWQQQVETEVIPTQVIRLEVMEVRVG